MNWKSPKTLVPLVVLGAAACAGGLSQVPSRRGASSAPAPLMAAVATPAGVTLPLVENLYDDPRLAGARQKERSHDYEGAAAIVANARRENAADLHASCTWAYVEGRLELAANNPAAALPAFDAAAKADGNAACGLSPYARLRAAQAAAKLSQWDVVLDRLAGVPDDSVLIQEKLVGEAEARFAKGDRAGAAAIWRRMLASDPFASRWVDSSAKLATALLDGVLGDPKGGAREAYDLATRILVSAPKFADAQGAAVLRSRAAGLLQDGSHPDALTIEERTKEVQVLLDGGDAVRAASEANSAFAAAGKTPPCKLAIVRAQAIGKTKQSSDAAWSDAIALCEGQPEQVTAYFGGGKASSSKRPDEARQRFAKVEERFPKHRLADDARLLSASLVRDAGDEEAFAKMLLTLPDDYPEGDMRAEALFRVALERMKKADWRGAVEPLERTTALSLPPKSLLLARAKYFLARCADESGDLSRAHERYETVVREYPLSYPMLLAYRRLADKDASDAKRVLDQAMNGGNDAARAPIRELDAQGLLRAARLMEVGEIDAAKREVTRAGLKEGGEASAAVGQLFEKVGAFDVGAALARKGDTLLFYPNERWRYVWEAAYPRAHEDIVRPEASKNGIPVSLAWAIMREESSFVVEAKSPANAFGLMQLILPTAKLVAQGTGLPFDEGGLKRADVNVTFGTKLLGQLRGSLGEARILAPAAYNAGAGALGRWRDARRSEPFDLFVEEIPYEETRNYVKKVLSSQATYALLYDRDELGEVLPLAVPARGP